MIETQVDIPRGYLEEEQYTLEQWCDTNIGPCAWYRDNVSEEKPWCCSTMTNHIEFYFARKGDAAMFILRWL